MLIMPPRDCETRVFSCMPKRKPTKGENPFRFVGVDDNDGVRASEVVDAVGGISHRGIDEGASAGGGEACRECWTWCGR